MVGSQWSVIAKEFRNRTANQVKNRFYSTLRRVAIKKHEQSGSTCPLHPQSKKFLLQYVDDAISFGHNCASKRGRKKKKLAPQAVSEQAGPDTSNKYECPAEKKPELPPLPPLKIFEQKAEIGAADQPSRDETPAQKKTALAHETSAAQPSKDSPALMGLFQPFAAPQENFTACNSSGAGYNIDVKMQFFGKFQELMAAQRQLSQQVPVTALWQPRIPDPRLLQPMVPIYFQPPQPQQMAAAAPGYFPGMYQAAVIREFHNGLANM